MRRGTRGSNVDEGQIPPDILSGKVKMRGPGGGRRRTLKASTLRRMLKKKGKKTTGKKATLLKRLKE